MVFKRKLSPAARAASVMKAISSAEKTAMQAVSGWGKTTGKALSVSQKNLATASRRASSLQARAANALKRVRRARAKQVKAIAGNARKLVQTELASARANLKVVREAYATAKAAHKLFLLVEKGVVSGVQAAEKAARPKGLRRRLRKMIS
jgi:hypothetical protein